MVTNSFHMTAFSIIFEKRFQIFLHSSLGARIRNILKIHNLEDRLYQEGIQTDIEAPIDWNKVKKRTEENIKLSEAFLMENLL